MEYGLYKVEEVAEGSLRRAGRKACCWRPSWRAQVLADAKVTKLFRQWPISWAAELAGTVARHPLAEHPGNGAGYYGKAPLLSGDFVTDDAGTGFVHIAPSHGEDDWKLGMANGLPVPETVLPDGTYAPIGGSVRRLVRVGPGQRR